jgi:hypothetical protein
MSLLASMEVGACLAFLTFAWTPLWRVETPTCKLAEMKFGSFWEFLGNLPEALEHLSTPQTPMNVLTMLPTVYLWENVRAT